MMNRSRSAGVSGKRSCLVMGGHARGLAGHPAATSRSRFGYRLGSSPPSVARRSESGKRFPNSLRQSCIVKARADTPCDAGAVEKGRPHRRKISDEIVVSVVTVAELQLGVLIANDGTTRAQRQLTPTRFSRQRCPSAQATFLRRSTSHILITD